ncbi:MAG: hypothetical protein MUE42_13790 [Opitutaceae bacterium]|jgi:hypothetical protein|nr:hypothetical protein [Opitutaceae bacterium]
MRPPAHDPLSALLHRADPAATAAAGDEAAFIAGVHARLRSSPAGSSPVLLFPSWLARRALPLAAALAVLASLATGGGLAYAREQRIRTEAYASAYARSIDPWLMHAARTSEDGATLQR